MRLSSEQILLQILLHSLGKDAVGDQQEESWNYVSVIGILLYLSSNFRPDITFAVHQASQFMHCAKQSCEKAIIKIGQYLRITKTKGLWINQSKDTFWSQIIWRCRLCWVMECWTSWQCYLCEELNWLFDDPWWSHCHMEQ